MSCSIHLSMQQARPFLLAQKADAHGSKNAENQYLTGLVIEKDGLTEEEILAELQDQQNALTV
jgi:hypothetical protein